MKLTKETENEVLKVYNTWLHAYLTGDVKTYDQYLDDAYHFIGSTNNEEFLSREATTKFFEDTAEQFAGKTELRNESKTLEQFGELIFITHFFDAWFLSEADWVYYGRFRFSSVLRNNKEGWRFIYQHFSMPDSKAQEGETIGYDQISAENLQLREAIKRRTIELENKHRELEIETALERVRAVSMSMHRSSDLAMIGEVIFNELKDLGFADLRNTEVVINHDKKNYITSYYYSDYGVTGVVDLDYKGNPVLEKWASDLQKADDAFAEVTIPHNEIKQWIKYRDSLGYVPDPKLKTANSVYYYSYSIGLGALSISSFSPISAIQLKTLQRFRNVFNLSYQRYVDIEKAEAQTREARIDLALERIRAQALAMRESTDLLDIVVTMRTEFVNLGHEAHYFWHMRWLPEIYEKAMTSGDGTRIGMVMELPRHIHGNIPLLAEWEKSDKSTVIYAMDAEAAVDYVDKMINLGDFKQVDPNAPSPDDIRHIGGLTFIMARTTHGEIGYSLPGKIEEVPQSDLDILIRFAGAFDLAHKRFEDLKKSEQQAREVKIELALEKVRSRTMGMQKSDELKEVVKVIFDQLAHLDINAEHAGIVVDYEPEKDWHFWVAENQDIPSRISVPYLDLPWDRQFAQAKENGMDFFTTHLDFEEKNSFYQELLPHIPGLTEETRDFYFKCPGLAISTTLQEDIGLYIENFSGIPYSEAENAILKRFGKVFQQTYTRFLDLHKAEAQAREARIETALEKVRSKTMAMQHSDDLPEAANALFLEIQALGIPAWSCGYNILAEDLRSATCWMSSEGALQAPFKLRLFGEASFEEMGEFVRSNESFLVQELGGKTIEDHYDYMKSFPDLLPTFEHIEEQGLSLPTYQINHLCRFAHGFLLFITYEPVPESHDIFKRFTKVFEQTYTRFLDLQKAEAQAREAQVESALERVRARSMAMHKSEELAGLSLELVKQVQALGVKTWFCAFNIYDDDPQGSLEWGSNGQGTFPKYRTPREGVFLRYYEAGQKGETLLVNEIGANECAAHYEYLCSLPGVGDQLLKMKEAGIPFPASQIDHVAYFKYGYILFITYEPTPESHDIFKRFARVFEQTYTRFLDLKNVEAQTRSAHIEAALERVRARALAMQEPEELTEVAEVLRYEMGLLGVEELETSSIFINDGENQKAECWYAIKDIRSDGKKLVSDHFPLNLDLTWVGQEMKKFYASTRDQVSIVMRGEARKEWISYCANQSGPLKGYYGEEIPDRTYHLFKFSHGAIGAASAGKISGESWDLLKRAAAVFSLAYSRFKDLTQARLDLQKLKEEKKRAEEALKELQVTQTQLIQSEKMASLGELTAGIAHEIQNPLNFVNNFSEVSVELLEEMDEELEKGDLEEARVLVEDIKQNLEKINHHGKRADGIVKGMLQHSRSSNGQKEPTDLNALADEYLRLAYHGLRAKDKGFNANLETHFDDTIGKVNVVSQDIGRVILNLITNAFYVVKEKKEQQHQGYEPTVTVTTKKEGNKVMIMVKDNGNGIPDAVREKIFQPFFTTKPTGQGTGLGLSMSYDIVTKGHGGELKVETREGEGTEFRIVLPGKEK